MWKLEEGRYYDSGKTCEQQKDFVFMLIELQDRGIVTASESMDGDTRIVSQYVVIGDVKITQNASYRYQVGDINTFHLLRETTYTAQYNG